MNGISLTFMIIAYLGAAAVLGYYGWRSVQRRAVQPELAMAVAFALVSWLEGPYDKVVHVAFEPSLPRMPSWWPLPQGTGGLIAFAPAGYLLYLMIPMLGGFAIAMALIKRGAGRLPALLVCGFISGALLELVGQILGTRVGTWRYSESLPGLTLFPHTQYQVPLSFTLATAIFTMVATYLLGRARLGPAGSTPPQAPRATLKSFVAYVVILHVVWGAVLVPHWIAYAMNLYTVRVPGPLF